MDCLSMGSKRKNMINKKGIEKATKDLLIALGVNLKDANFLETPN